MKQIIKLGLTGSETTLPTESRINQQGAPTLFANESRSANKTLHVDYIATKESWSITWDILSKEDYESLYAIYTLQISTPSFLSFIYTDEQGTEITKTVKCGISNKGALVQQCDWYYSGVALSLEEV